MYYLSLKIDLKIGRCGNICFVLVVIVKNVMDEFIIGYVSDATLDSNEEDYIAKDYDLKLMHDNYKPFLKYRNRD